MLVRTYELPAYLVTDKYITHVFIIRVFLTSTIKSA